MAIEATFSKFKKSNLKIYIIVCFLLAAWCAYDGYFNDEWIEEHTESDGSPKTYLVFNRKAPYYLVGTSLFFGACLYIAGKKKVTAEDNELVICDKIKIPYDSIEKINKTYFESKGYFIITYKDAGGKETECKLSERKYDNLGAVLEHLVSAIS